MANNHTTVSVKLDTMNRVRNHFIQKLALKYIRLYKLLGSADDVIFILDRCYSEYMEMLEITKIDILNRAKEIRNG